MSRPRFPLTAEQLELLLAFATHDSLGKLAPYLARDASAVSRQLQRLAETAPVLAKSEGRWRLTPLGREINAKSLAFLAELQLLLSAPVAGATGQATLAHPALLVINAQQVLLQPGRGDRSNADAEANVGALLTRCRARQHPVLHVRHIDADPRSAFAAAAPGAAFLPALAPIAGETVVDKSKASAFAGTDLLKILNDAQIQTLVLSGFTANECIDATARDAAALGFTTLVVGDATATFDLTGPDGKLHAAERVHRLTLANLHQFVAKVLSTQDLLQMLG